MSPAPLRRRRSTFNPFLAGMLGLLAVFGILLTLHFTGQVKLPMVDSLLGREVHAAEAGVERVPVLVTARDLSPGHAVQRADVWDPLNKNFRVVMMPRDSVNPEWILRWGEIEGRVMARAKLKDKAFRTSDFLPKGTRPGVAALVPAGMRMVNIPHGRIHGLDALRYQDRFDLIAQVAISEDQIEEAQDAIEGLSRDRRLELERLRGSAKRTQVCKDAMRLPDLPSSGAGSKAPIAIAVAESEVHRLVEVLEGKDDLACIVYSGNDVAWASRRMNVDYDPEKTLKEILDTTREVRIREGGETRMVRVNRYQEDK
jgi:SAF domain